MTFRDILPAILLAACAPGAGNQSSQNPFDDTSVVDGKADSGWQSSLDAAEVELDLEGDVSADAASLERAPLEVGQYALTYLRKNHDVYIQSLAEDYAHGADRVEWQVAGEWKSLTDVDASARAGLSHFRMRGVNAVVMHPGERAKLAGRVYQPVVPANPAGLWQAVGTACGTKEGSIDVEDGVYWYVWDPGKSGCKATTAKLQVTVSKVLPAGDTTYPEYDRLTADHRVDVLVLFGQVDHDTLSDSDYGFSLVSDFENLLTDGGFTKQTAPKGLRYSRTRAGIEEVIDIYTPREFAGLADFAHVADFDAAVRSHEIIVYNGHSMLGASDFWARPSIYSGDAADKYQIFLYNGCLGYEYYVNPILEGKKTWANVDLVSNVVETPFAIMVEESARTVGSILTGAETGGKVSWQTLLGQMNDIAGGESFYGASGIRDNAFQP
jgi:hypothetical protein